LLLASISKIHALTIQNEAFLVPDPLFHFLDKREMMLSAIAMEATVLVILLWPRMSIKKQLGAICWIASLFLIYRIGLRSVSFSGGCDCLGAGKTTMPASLSEAILAYLLLGGFGLRILHRISTKSLGMRNGILTERL
jgi:hypothetical protein